MKTILLLTKDIALWSVINSLLTSIDKDCECIRPYENVAGKELKLVIIDLSMPNHNSIMAEVNPGEYIPTIAIADHKEKANDHSNADFIISQEEIQYLLPNIYWNLMRIKTRHNSLRYSYDTINLINSETEKLFKESMSNESIKLSNVIDPVESLIRHVFVFNKSSIGKPSIIYTFDKNMKTTLINAYSHHDNILFKNSRQNYISSDIFDNFILTLNRTVKFHEDPSQVFKSYFELFKCDFLDKPDSVKNSIYYSTGDTLIAALNYRGIVLGSDWDIIKNLSINFGLLKRINTQINNVNNAFIYTVHALARAAEAEDDETGTHIKRVNEYSRLISERLGMDSKFLETICFSAQMHDVGKIHIPQEILKKSGKLTPGEFDLMKQHTIFGAKIIGDSPQLSMASEIALNHHEKYDGSGYPYGISGSNIPLSARIVALADIYDALRSRRNYKPSFSHEDTFKIITEGDGRVSPEHFDPEILNVFHKYHIDFESIYVA